MRAARQAIDNSGVPVVLTARCEAGLVGHPDAIGVAIERLVAFAEAGADCLFAPGLGRPEDLAAIIKAVAPKPVNVLASNNPALPAARLADMGVRRISLGSSLARVAWHAFIRTAQGIAEEGTFDALSQAAPFSDLDQVFGA
ncbi:isocitrate lyase/phosphoenolpyruvate mutase family protein [Streptomyces griseoaurantiacus]|uniref:isocitrate lyase/phosphoenolpyruvate mutase family protein n=1 Tax=Streptomyces griseoaurantiacus TaxID=68213 RepID=UPI0037880542